MPANSNEMIFLEEDDWHERRAKHKARVRRWIEPRLERAARHERDPVEDFLFEYYPYRPAKLLHWHPGIGVELQGETAREYLSDKDYHETQQGVTVGVSHLSVARIKSIGWIGHLLRRTADRIGAFDCFGLHEWAMVYEAESIRHPAWPLRITAAEIACSYSIAANPLHALRRFSFFHIASALAQQISADTRHDICLRTTGLPAHKHGPLQVGFQTCALHVIRPRGGLL